MNSHPRHTIYQAPDLSLVGPNGLPLRGRRTSAPPTKPGPDGEILPGTHIDHFEVIREIGRGGMGHVLLARDTKLARLVAMKVLNITNAHSAERFIVEARATARCQHENIVVIYGVDEWCGMPYMALEYLEGSTLSAMADNDVLPLPQVLPILIKVVRALVRAHSFDIVHCDLKPENIFVTRDGGVKVLDFGIARLTGSNAKNMQAVHAEIARGLQQGTIDDEQVCGTPAYMALEQWGIARVDHRADIWAVGILFWEMLASSHPMGHVKPETVVAAAGRMDEPLPSLATAAPHLPRDLVAIVDRCLVKRKEGRYATAQELLEALENLDGAESRTARKNPDASPFLGLAAFQEGDADRFFGREQDVAMALSRLDDRPFVTLAGPSGIGKSSFLRAGVVPALRSLGAWDVVIMRPGRAPLTGLVQALSGIDAQQVLGPHDDAGVAAVVKRAKAEPGYVGASVRAIAQQRGTKVLIFVDQFEETFTNASVEERVGFVQTLLGIADDVSSPLRVIVSIRSDFIDRANEHPQLMEAMTRGLMFLRPLGRSSLTDALAQPLAQVGYKFEDDALLEQMIGELSQTASALPLLQFAANSLWEQRDRTQRKLTRAAYNALGGIGGALANHAESIVAGLSTQQQNVFRQVVLRLVTAEGTRAVAERSELEALGAPGTVAPLLDLMIGGRLLAADSDSVDARLELIHESLISHWPSLRRWREDLGEHAALLQTLGPAAKQWDAKGRPRAMLWFGDELVEAKLFAQRFGDDLGAAEAQFVKASVAEVARQTRNRRFAIIGGFGGMAVLVAAAVIALLIVRNAQRDVIEQRDVATREQQRAQVAEASANQRLAEIQAEQALRKAADQKRVSAEAAAKQAASEKQVSEQNLVSAQDQVAQSREDVEAKNVELREALNVALGARKAADIAAAKAEAAQAALAARLAADQAELAKLRREAGKLSTGDGLR